MPPSPPPSRNRRVESSKDEFEQLKRLIHGKLVDKLDLSRLGEFEPYERGDLDPETIGEPLRLGSR